MSGELWIAVVCLSLTFTAAVSDAVRRRIPNWVVLPGMLLGVAANALIPGGIGATAAAVGLAAGLLAFLPAYVLRLLGAGDVKLMAMVGSFLGATHLLGAILASFVAGGVLALAVAWRAGQLGHVTGNIRLILYGMLMRVALPGSPTVAPATPTVRMPYGIAIAAGTLLYLLWVNVAGVRP